MFHALRDDLNNKSKFIGCEMAVLIEAISVVVKADSIIRKYPGGWHQFQLDVRNQTLCADGELARVGFMSPHDVQSYVGFLESKGLIFQAQGSCIEIAVVDQQRGFAIPCEWADFGRIFIDSSQTQKISACRMKGSNQRIVSYPDGWEYEGSLSQDYHFILTENTDKELEYIRKEGGVAVFKHLPTGKIVYSGSPTIGLDNDVNDPVSLNEMVASNFLAHAYNTRNACFIEKLLADDILYTSQWVLDEMRGKDEFLSYLSAKFNTITKAGNAIFAELATYRGKHCLIIAQASKENPVATMLVKTTGSLISEIHMCEVPHYSECERLGIYP
jgi:hypothetical protein